MPGPQAANECIPPRCPHCGCNASHLVRRPGPAAPVPTGIAICGYCGRRFRFSEADDPAESAAATATDGEADRPVPYRIVRERLRCPQCRSTEFKTDTTRPESPDGSILRYHVCDQCSHRFSSLER